MSSPSTEVLARHPALPTDTENNALKVAWGQPGLEDPAQPQLLDLPTELLLDILHDAGDLRVLPHDLRATCRGLRDLLDSACRRLRLCPRGARARQLQALRTLLPRLPQLRSLDNGLAADFKTLPFLADVPALEALTLAGCPITSIKLKALGARPALTALNLSACCNLININAVSALTALRSLDLSNCNALAGVAALVHCPQLTSLRLSRGLGCEVDLGPLATLHSLQSLVLHHNEDPNFPLSMRLVDLSPLSSCTNLTLQDVRGDISRVNAHSHSGRVRDLRPLQHCTRLTTLLLDCSDGIDSLAPLLPSHASLTHLHVVANEVTDLSPLSSCVHLTSLDLHLPFLQDPRPLQACHRAATLRLDGCRLLQDLRPLAALAPSLTALTLCGCGRDDPHLDLAQLQALTELRDLDLTLARFPTMLPLATLPKLALLRVEEDRAQSGELDALRAARGPMLTVDEVD